MLCRSLNDNGIPSSHHPPPDNKNDVDNNANVSSATIIGY
jgi:hypothetical protein